MLNKIKNLPISFDFHGDSSLSKRFQEFDNSDISFYLDLDTTIGKDTCGQACEHCWFVNYEKVKKKLFDLDEGKVITDKLKEQGYKIYPRYVDSFAYRGKFLQTFGPAHNREFRMGKEKEETDTMLNGDAWTSGKPLLVDDYRELLDIAYEAGYRTISITYHGVINDYLEIDRDLKYPIKGVFSGSDTEIVVKRIFDYNKETERDFRVNIGLTLGRHNGTQDNILKYALYFNRMGVNTVRFNSFTDHSGKHSHMVFSDEETVKVYKDIKWLHENVQLNFQVGMSEDFGTVGIETMGFPEEVGWCQAGHQYFVIIPVEMETVNEDDEMKKEKIGQIAGCVNIFEPNFGGLYRITNKSTNKTEYQIDMDAEAINIFNMKRDEGVYQNGCYAKELLNELNESGHKLVMEPKL